MSNRQRQFVSDLLFGVQLVLTVFFCSGQFWHMLYKGTQNLSMSMVVCMEIFVTINWVLALRGHQADPSRITRQGIVIYAFWVILWGMNLGLALWKHTPWDQKDIITLGLVAAGAVTILIIAKLHNTGIKNPIVRGYLSLAFKAVPQLAQAYKNVVMGGAPGIGWIMVWIGHATILTRIGQLLFAKNEAKQEKNRTGLLISEIGNELSWVVATITWLVF